MTRTARRSPAIRVCWLLAAALQLLLPGAAAWADARLDAAEAHAVAHIESHTTKSCARIHPPDCALCHFLTSPAREPIRRVRRLRRRNADHCDPLHVREPA